MDRHNVSDTVTADHVAQLHREDLKIEHKFNCKGLTYWFDGKRKTAFCLVKAPNKQAVLDMHNHAHGVLPHKIIEVDENIVESFLGRIEDPEIEQTNELTIINEPAFRVLMVIKKSTYLSRLEANQFSLFSQKFHNSVLKSIKYFKGRIVKRDNYNYLASFSSVSNAVFCALKIQSNFKYITPKFDLPNRKINVALSTGDPVSNRENIFEDAIVLATRMCEMVNEQLVISNEVKSLYNNENRNASISKNSIRTLKPAEEKFLTKLMDYIDVNWNNLNLNVNNFSKELGYSKSQLYRKLIKLSGKSPNNFIKEFKLHKALNLLRKQDKNISEIAYETGFNSPAYFSKCFMDKYGILPSKYIQQHII
jgi:AraC-like DNA-binding protein